MRHLLPIILVIALAVFVSGCTQPESADNQTTSVETTLEETITTTLETTEETTTSTSASFYELSETDVTVRVNSGGEGYEDANYVEGQTYYMDEAVANTNIAAIEISFENTGQNKLMDMELIDDCKLYREGDNPPDISSYVYSKFIPVSYSVFSGNQNYIDKGGKAKVNVTVTIGIERGSKYRSDWEINATYELRCTLRIADNKRNAQFTQKIENYFISISELH